MDVVLIAAPFTPANRPSIGISILSACLKREGIKSSILYRNVAFRDAIGHEDYDSLVDGKFASVLLGEWLFSRFVCPSGSIDSYFHFIKNALPHNTDEKKRERTLDKINYMEKRISNIIELSKCFIDETVSLIQCSGARIVGLSSIFQSHLCCLALAAAIKARLPEVFVVLGGSNCDGDMGLETFNSFPFLDAVISGPGEIAFTELVQDVLSGAPVRVQAGVYVRNSETALSGPTRAEEPSLDDIPHISYDDFFQQWGDRPAFIPIETSRGCWWGQKHHCVFCSLNGLSMTYRSKSRDRILREFREILKKYPGRRIIAVDNIMPLMMIDDVLPELAKIPGEKHIFYETKANLTKESLAIMRDAGIDQLQPGIESLDDRTLRLMNKGITGLRNIQFLKHCKELGIHVDWAILRGFPFDTAESYQYMAELMPVLSHLTPPHSWNVQLERFSPLYTDGARFGVTNIRPNQAYYYIYPFDENRIYQLSYFFESDQTSDPTMIAAKTALLAAIDVWRDGSNNYLFHQDIDNILYIFETRNNGFRHLHALDNMDRDIYHYCDSLKSIHAIFQHIIQLGYRVSQDEVERTLKRFVSGGLMANNNNIYLSLSVKLNRRYLPNASVMSIYLDLKQHHQTKL